jgi:hypothetical protein
VVGGVLYVGRFLGGERWVPRALVAVVALAGAAVCNSTLFGASSAAAPVEAAIGLAGEAQCGARLLIVALAAMAVGAVANATFDLAVFAAGAAGAGHVASMLLPALADAPWPRTAAVALAAFLGGVVLSCQAAALLDMALSMLGALLLAHAATRLYAAHPLPSLPDPTDAYALYVLVFQLLLSSLRVALLSSLAHRAAARAAHEEREREYHLMVRP